MRVAHITAVFGGFDTPKILPDQSVSVNSYSFTEENNKIDLTHFNDRTKALYYKQQHHRIIDADIYIWTDGKIQIRSNDFVKTCLTQLTGDIAILKHGERSCVYEEIDYIESEMSKGSVYLLKRYKERDLKGQAEKYRTAGYPENNGLNDCSIIAWRKTPETIDIMNRWWLQCADEKTFDQTAIQFICWQREMKIIPLELNGMFNLVKHLK